MSSKLPVKITGASQQLVKMDINVATTDVVAIAVDAAEKLLRQSIKDKQAELKLLNKQISEFDTSLEAEMKKLFVSTEEELLKIGKQLHKLGAKGFTTDLKSGTSISVEEVDGSLKEVVGVVRLFEPTKTKSNYIITPLIVVRKTRKATAALRKAFKQLADLRSQKDSLEHDLRELFNKLSSMGSMERSFRAKLATHQLQQTEAGKEILDKLLDSVQAEIDSL